MKLDWKNAKKPLIVLSPMADMTDSAFCRVVREVTESFSRLVVESKRNSITQRLNDSTTTVPIVFREMVSSEAVIRGNDKTLGMTEIHPAERPLVQQVFGSDPDVMAEAARIISEQHQPEGFDINMGCPVYKIVHNFNGAALMKEPERATQIIKKMKAVISVPLSVKIRLGWSDPNDCLEFSKVLEAAGADLITVHGRTKAQGYSGKADWNKIAEVKKGVAIPVLANGDVHDPSLVPHVLDVTGCDGILIARGALGNPWFFSRAQEALAHKPLTPISTEERIRVVLRHAELHVEQYGERGLVTFRKHLSWYFKGQRGSKIFREELMKLTELSALQRALYQFQTEQKNIRELHSHDLDYLHTDQTSPETGMTSRAA